MSTAGGTCKTRQLSLQRGHLALPLTFSILAEHRAHQAPAVALPAGRKGSAATRLLLRLARWAKEAAGTAEKHWLQGAGWPKLEGAEAEAGRGKEAPTDRVEDLKQP